MKKILYLIILIVALTFAVNVKKGIFATTKNPITNAKLRQSEENKPEAYNKTSNDIAAVNASSNKIGSLSDKPETSDNKAIGMNNKQTTNKETASSNSSLTSSNSQTSITLVNRNSVLDKNFIPQSLRVPAVKFMSYANPMVKKMDVTASKHLEDLFNAAKADGITLLAVSGYRDYAYQKNLYNNKVAAVGQKEADKYVAKPGTSEHQTGLAMDVLSNEYTSLDDGFANTKAYRWLENNSYKFGFIIRYPKDKESITGYNYEPWHIRYVGVAAATEISQKQITLEEYLKIFV